MTLLSMSSRSSMDRAPARCSGGHGFDSCRGFRIFLCPMLVSCWLIHLHYLWPDQKFDTLFLTVAAGAVALKLKLWRTFVDVLIDNDEKVASSKKYTQLMTRVLKPYRIYNQNGQNRYPIYDYIKRLKNRTLWCRTYLYSPYQGAFPPGHAS